MNELKLHIADQDTSWPLDEGELAVSTDQGVLRRVDAGSGAVQFCADRRGVWLRVLGREVGVHVNGRQVRKMAMLRLGDAIYIEGAKVLLTRGQSVPWPDSSDLDDVSGEVSGDFRVILRGIGGKHHGRAVTLDRPRLVGSALDADVRIDAPDFAERHAQLTLRNDRIVLRDLGSANGTVLNGVAIRDALLQPGDQLVFDAHHRFVVEAPGKSIHRDESVLEADEPDSEPAAAHASWRRWPWLLLAAVLIAAALAMLLLFGAGK